MRVLHVGKYFPPDHGGMETYLADLVAAQRRLGMEVAVLVHGEPAADDPPWLMRVPTYGRLLYAPVAPGFLTALREAIRRYQPDVLHLHLPNTSAFWALFLPAARRIPWVVHWQSDVVISRIRIALAMAYRLYRPLEQALLARAARIVATSPPYLASSEALARWRSKCVVVPLGLDASRIPLPAPPVDELPWSQGAFRLLSIGRLTYYKGFETLVRVVAELPGVELVIVGEGELRRPLEKLIATTTLPGAAPRVALLGRVSEERKFGLLAACDAFCLASCERTEAFGLVLLEAMAYGKPCIVSALQGSGMPWVVEHAGAGALVPLGDLAAWRRQIEDLRTDAGRRRALGEAGRCAFSREFSVDRSARALMPVYRSLMEDPPLPASAVGLLVVIPAKDEAQTIGEVVGSLRAAGWADVLVIDDGSRDATGELAVAAGAVVLRPALPLGAWGAMQAGMRYAVRHGFGGVVTMDADGQHEVAAIPALLARSEEADVVIGACPERGSLARRLAWAWFRRLTGFGLEDLTSGFRYYNGRALQLLAGQEATLLDYQDVGVLLLLRRGGLRIAEVPVPMNERAVGKSRIFRSWVAVGRYMAATTLLCLARWRIPRRPTEVA